jgi:TonB-dependent SusC/RagA subfamily outer membrane receptor
MRRNLYLAFSLLVAACMPSKAKVAAAPASSVATTCSQQRAAIRYVVDGESATCTSAMALPRSSIASVEVLKGTAAALYGASAAESVVIIRTKQER